jgi:hypothetical protein
MDPWLSWPGSEQALFRRIFGVRTFGYQRHATAYQIEEGDAAETTA